MWGILRVRYAGHIANLGKGRRNSYKILTDKSTGKRPIRMMRR
jgi:hypothetical protein